MKLWLAKKLIQLLEFQWREVPWENSIEIQVKLAGTNRLLLKATLDGEKWRFEEY